MKNKLAILIIVLHYCFTVIAQNKVANNVFIITTDGFRWQEVFKGADSVLIHNAALVADTALIKQQFWADTEEERRAKLLPFFWNTIASNGQLYGNRVFGNNVDVSNIYKISYPGYNEILTGFADKRFIPNSPVNNKNITLLEFLNKQTEFAEKVVAFSSWNIFPNIINKKRAGIIVNSGYDTLNELIENDLSSTFNRVQNEVHKKGKTRNDLLTFIAAKEYIEQNHPKVVLLSFGETDEFAHHFSYDKYLQKANQMDRLIADLWYLVQTDPFYKNNTTFVITTDHGRGKKASRWFTHSLLTKGSGEIWMALLGAGIEPLGEIKKEQQVYQKQIAQTVANLLGLHYEAATHKVANAVLLPPYSNLQKNSQAIATLVK